MRKEGPWQVRQTVLEIDLSALKRNFKLLAKSAAKAELLIVLKSNAYGHSLIEIAKALDKIPAREALHGFGVANLEEAIQLRSVGIKHKIYVLSGIQIFNEDMQRCLKTCRIIPVISSLALLREMDLQVRKSKKSQVFHLKFNTGMNRLGIDSGELTEVISILKKNSKLQLEGIMSHYASAEKKSASLTLSQTKLMRKIAEQLQNSGIAPRYKHMANSSALENQCYAEGNIVRVGLHMYGVGNPNLKPVARWTAQVYQIRELKKGDSVGYGPLFRAKKDMRMAVLGVGYGDGYRRSFSNCAEVLIHGKRCPVIGAVSMDLTAVDISSVADISTKSTAVLLGSDGKEIITAEELAKHAHCIPYEILTGISSRVPRVIHGRT